MTKVATWNINSLRVRLPQVLDWLLKENPDILALQETKIIDEDFPLQEIKNAGYDVIFSGQKSYNGIAVLSKIKPNNIQTTIPTLEDPQKRVLAATIGNLRIINLYVPNGESINSEKYAYKLNWLQHMHHFLEKEKSCYENVIVLGDFNIAPSDIDVHDPISWQGKVTFTEKEKQIFQGFLDIGFSDCFRQKNSAEQSFSWWDYRLNSFKRNLGLRIDHIIATKSLANDCNSCVIDKLPRMHERPSDHAPVVAKFNV